MANEQLHFKTNVQLKSIIGKDLINDDNIAILELVKNSFDANAKKVEIKFYNLKENDDLALDNITPFTQNTSALIIQDDGAGMSLADIEDKWLNIAYSEKKNVTSQNNRLMAGAKGVGRFSCDRLGEYLNLYARKANSNDYIKLFVDWKKFEIEDDKDMEIQSVPISYETLTKEDLSKTNIDAFSHGVVLEIIKLRSNWVYPKRENENISWEVDKLIELKKYLEKLINPNQAFIENDFGIFLSAPEFEEENESLTDSEKFLGKVENRIFEKLDFKSTSIEAEIIDNGSVLYTELKDRGRTIFWIKEKNDFAPDIVNAKVVIYYLNPYTKAFFTKQTGIRSVDYGSIFLFINGFRVPPYGELGNDWLLLDQRKNQGYARFLGSREVVGRIEILDKNSNFKIISSREGIVRNDSFVKLTSTDPDNGYFYKAFRRLEKYVVDGLAWDSIPDDERRRISEIEKKIISGETKEQDLTYSEDDTTKSRRVYSSIHSIISARPENVIELYINEELISDKIAEEKEQSEREFEQLLTDFENKKIDPHTLEQLLRRKAEQNKDLERQLRDFSKYTTNEATSKAILDIQNYKRVVQEQAKIISDLKELLRIAETEKAKKESEAEQYKREAEAAKEELKEVISQNLFLKSVKSQDFDDIISFMHHAGIYAQTIESYLKNISLKLSRNIPITNDDLTEIIRNISFEARKILSITEFATKANFRLRTEDIEVDLVTYIMEYLNNIIPTVTDKATKLNIINLAPEGQFVRNIKPLEINILIDNLINNSQKAEAHNVQITLKSTDKKLHLIFADDGKGISKNNIDKIFDFGFTTTDGSGLGLYHVKQIVESMNGNINVYNNNPKGAIFELIL